MKIVKTFFIVLLCTFTVNANIIHTKIGKFEPFNASFSITESKTNSAVWMVVEKGEISFENNFVLIESILGNFYISKNKVDKSVILTLESNKDFNIFVKIKKKDIFIEKNTKIILIFKEEKVYIVFGDTISINKKTKNFQGKIVEVLSCQKPFVPSCFIFVTLSPSGNY